MGLLGENYRAVRHCEERSDAAISWKSISLAFLWPFSVTLRETYLPENSGKREALPLFCNLFLSKIVRAENTCN